MQNFTMPAKQSSSSYGKRPSGPIKSEPPPKVFLHDERAGDGFHRINERLKRNVGESSGDAGNGDVVIEENEESIPEAERATDMQFADIDVHALPDKGIKKIEEQKEVEPPIYPNQAYLAKVIVERIAHITEKNKHSVFKLRPLLEQANSNREVENDNCYDSFNFMIYTAISNMLEHQTAMRLADPQSEVLSPEIYKSSWKIRGREALSKVHKYHPEVINSTHKDLVKEVESNPRTLFLIVADEAHVAITKNEEEDERNVANLTRKKTKSRVSAGAGDEKTESELTEEQTELTAKEKETANNTLVNFWKDDLHPNVIVLQVSATPSNLLTSGSRIPDVRIVKTGSHDSDSSDGDKFDLRTLKNVEFDSRREKYLDENKEEVKGRASGLNHVKWTESHDLQIKQGIVVTLKMFDVWLCIDEESQTQIKPFIGTSAMEGREPRYHFSIQGDNGIVSVHTGKNFMWRLVVIPPEDPRKPENAVVGFVHKESLCENTNYIKEFLMGMEVGENAFHLIADVHGKSRHLKLDPTDTDNEYYPVVVSHDPHEPVRLAGLVDGETYLTFCIGHKWNGDEYKSLLDGQIDENAFTRVYVPLNHYYSTMSLARKKERKIRQDLNFQKLVLDVKESKRKDHVLAADYSYYILLTEHLRQNNLVFNTLAEVLNKPAEAFGVYNQHRTEKLNIFRRRLGELHQARGEKMQTSGETDFSPIPEEIFNKVVENHEERSAKDFAQFILKPVEDDDGDNLEELYLKKLLNCLYHFDKGQWERHISDKIDHALEVFNKILGKDIDLKKLFRKKKNALLDANETYQIVNDLIVKPEAKSLDGKMKIVRVSSIKNGNTLYTSLCLARQVVSNNNDSYTFEVIRDFGNFKLRDFQKKGDSKLVQRKMVYRVRRTLQQDKCGYRDPHTLEPCKCVNYAPKKPDLECKACGHEHTEIATYKDLNKLPCILILQRRGRLGDTFPRSFNCMDLRICYTNEIGNLSTVVQDLGRMCRYATRKDGLEYDDLPYALIGRKLAEALSGKRDRKKETLDVMKKHSNFQGAFLAKGGNYLDFYCKADAVLKGVVHPKKPSFDCDNKEKHHNRILLEAEPQIGKTGVYLGVIAKLRKLIQGEFEEEYESSEEIDEEDTDGEEPQEALQIKNDLEEEWQYPYHKNMKLGRLPKSTAEGKYSRIYGPYQYGERPIRNIFREESAFKRKQTKKRSIVSRYKSYTADHNTCPDCSITVGHQIVTVRIVGTESRLWIPNRERYGVVRRKLNCPDISTLEANTLADMSEEDRSGELEYSSVHLKSWIFTPTHGRALNGNLNLTHSMVCPKSKRDTYVSYVHILVVRPGQFEEYCRRWGSSHVILELPEQVSEWFEEHGENCTAEAGKIGYSRRFIQAFAERYDLHTIFMLDDTMPYFYELITRKDDDKDVIDRDAKNHVKQKRVPLHRVLKHLESLYDSYAVAPKEVYEACGKYPALTRGSYTGPPDSYGVIGIRKHSKHDTRVVNPFKNTHVYSLCLINIRALKMKRIQYQPWQAWEDLNLNNQCDEKGLYVVKYNRFKVFKRTISTWQNEAFRWQDDTQLTVGTKPIDEEENILFRWIKNFARPGRCEVSWPEDDEIPSEVDSLVGRIRTLCRAKDHFAAVHPKMLNHYLHNTKGLACFVKHVLILPLKTCMRYDLTRLSAFRKEVIEPHFEPEEKEGEIRFRVVTSHNVNKFDLSMILVYVEGKIKNPNRDPCENPYNLPVPVKKIAMPPKDIDSPTDAQVDPSSSEEEINQGECTPAVDSKMVHETSSDVEHDENTISEKSSITFAPDSDEEDSSSPIITGVEKPDVEDTTAEKMGESELPRSDVEERMVVSDDEDKSNPKEGTEDNPIALSDDESGEDEIKEITNGDDLKPHLKRLTSSQSPIDVDETQGIPDGYDTQKTTSSDDSIPFDLKPSQSPRAVLSSVPDITNPRSDSESDEERGSPNLLEPTTSQASAPRDSASEEGRGSPSLLEPTTSQAWTPRDGSLTDDELVSTVEKIEKRSVEKGSSRAITANAEPYSTIDLSSGAASRRQTDFSSGHTHDKTVSLVQETVGSDWEPSRYSAQQETSSSRSIFSDLPQSFGGPRDATTERSIPTFVSDLRSSNKDVSPSQSQFLSLSDLEVHNARTGKTKPLESNYRLQKGVEHVQVKAGNDQKMVSKGEIKALLSKYNVKEKT